MASKSRSQQGHMFHWDLAAGGDIHIDAMVSSVLAYSLPVVNVQSWQNKLVLPPRECYWLVNAASVVTFARPPTRSCLKITSRSFRYASPYLWNQLPHSLTSSATSLSASSWFICSPRSSHLASVIITIIIHYPIILPFQTQNFPISQILPSIYRHLASLWTDFTDTRTALRLFSVSVFF